MKKVKIMFMSLLLLGVVGGALAFKAKFNNDYCTTLPRIQGANLVCTVAGGGANLTCPDLLENQETTIQGQVFAVCTTVTAAGADPCPDNRTCITPIQSLKTDQ